jgi:hypothetical protein
MSAPRLLAGSEVVRLILNAFDGRSVAERDAALDFFCRVWPKFREATAAKRAGNVVPLPRPGA